MTVEEPADHRLRHRPAADERETLSRERHRPKVCRAHEGTRIPTAFRSLRRAYGVVRPRAPPVAFLFVWSKTAGRPAIPVQTRFERPSARVALGLRLERSARARPTVRRDDARGRRARGF